MDLKLCLGVYVLGGVGRCWLELVFGFVPRSGSDCMRMARGPKFLAGMHWSMNSKVLLIWMSSRHIFLS